MRFLTSRGFRYGIAAVVFAALPIAGYAAATGEVGITLTATGPQPSITTAALGDSVKFTSDGNQLYVVSSEKTGFVSPPLTTAGQSASYTLTTSGNFDYKQIGGAKLETRGQIIVKKEGEVSLGTNKNTIVYGSSVTLTGQAAPTGFPVMLQRRLPGERNWFDVASTPTNPDGTFSTTVQPTIATQYRATLFGRELISPVIRIQLTPKLRIVRATPRKPATGARVTVTAQLTPGSAATAMDLARYDKERAKWVKIATSPVAPITGAARFVWKAEYGRSLLRVQLTQNRVRPGFLVANSTWTLVQGIGAPPEPEEKGGKRKRRNR